MKPVEYGWSDLQAELELNSGYKRKIAILAYRFKFYCYHVRKSRFLLILAKVISRISSYICMYEIPVESVRIGSNLTIPHGFSGCFFAPHTNIGKNAIIYHNVTIGILSEAKRNEKIEIGDNVIIGCNTALLGKVNIANGIRIPAGSTLFNPEVLEN